MLTFAMDSFAHMEHPINSSEPSEMQTRLQSRRLFQRLKVKKPVVN